VTGIRHWSTPDYTRVAIDVESDVQVFIATDRNSVAYFFDLNGTKLASTLVGKSFDVDDGFLKKVRVAQFAPGRTRVVLEVDNLSDYDAFLLPNPYRLIIDIHGKNGRAKRKEAGETSLAEETRVIAPKLTGEAGSNSLATKTTDLTPAAAQTAVVKRVVDADDDDDDADVPASGIRKAKCSGSKERIVTSRNGVASKRLIDNDLDSQSDTLDFRCSRCWPRQGSRRATSRYGTHARLGPGERHIGPGYSRGEAHGERRPFFDSRSRLEKSARS